jgi:hypothetical protein
MVAQMRVPLIQGTLRYAYRIENLPTSCSNLDVCHAEGATFAAAVLPAVHYCDATAATIIYNAIGMQSSTVVDFSAIKTAFESVYGCLNITCADVGGFWNTGVSPEAYHPGAEPCTFDATPTSSSIDIPTWGIAVIAVLGTMFLIFTICFLYVIRTERQTSKPFFFTLQGSSTSGAAPV